MVGARLGGVSVSQDQKTLHPFLLWTWQDPDLGTYSQMFWGEWCQVSGCLCGAPGGSHLLSYLGLEGGEGQVELWCSALRHPAGGSSRACLGNAPYPWPMATPLFLELASTV